MARSSSKGARLAVKEARLITAELRRLGVPPHVIAKIWLIVIAVPVVIIIGYLLINYDSGSNNPTILNGVVITFKNQYESHVHNNTTLTLKSLTLTCSPGGDSQPVTTTSRLYPPLKPGYGEDAYVQAGCKLLRVNESHQLW
jgi:hypothetical protein